MSDLILDAGNNIISNVTDPVANQDAATKNYVDNIIGGADTEIQFNDGGVFAGQSDFTFDKSTGKVSIGDAEPTGQLSVSGAGVGSGEQTILTLAANNGTPWLMSMTRDDIPDGGVHFYNAGDSEFGDGLGGGLEWWVDTGAGGFAENRIILATKDTFHIFQEVDMHSQLIFNLGAPINPGDAATKGYVDERATASLPVKWNQNNADTPETTVFNNVPAYLFPAAGTALLYGFLKIPEGFATGRPLKIYVPYECDDNSPKTVLLSAETVLYRPEDTAFSSTTNNYISTNTAVTCGGANIFQYSEIDMTDSIGRINSLTVRAGDILFIILSRGTDTSTEDTKVFADLAEVTPL